MKNKAEHIQPMIIENLSHSFRENGSHEVISEFLLSNTKLKQTHQEINKMKQKTNNAIRYFQVVATVPRGVFRTLSNISDKTSDF